MDFAPFLATITARQREVLEEEWAKHGICKPLKYYEAKTRISVGSLKRLIRDIQSGNDITKPARGWRKQKCTPELLKKVTSELCVQNRTLREAKATIIGENMEAIRAGNEPLPVVSVSTMSRYVKNDAVMDEIDTGPVSFTEVTRRCPAAISEENKTLRFERRSQLDRSSPVGTRSFLLMNPIGRLGTFERVDGDREGKNITEPSPMDLSL